jgi:LysM repeat protein
MKKRNSYFARLLALLALLAAIAAVILLVQAALKQDDDDGKGKNTPSKQSENQKKPRTKAKTYVVKPGDTLTKISHQTGIRVSEIVALNPEVDPLVLTAGETLKLR